MHQSHQQRTGQPATFNELLINEVKAHPQLYNQQHRVCTDNGERNVIWEVIAQRIDESVSGEFAKKRWLQMRDRYRKELKMSLRTSIQPKWPYFVKLSWLDPYLKGAKSIDSESNSPLGQQNNLISDFGIASKQDFAGINNILIAAENNDHQLQFPPPNVNLLETLIAASREFLERQQRDKQESVCTSSAFSNNDLNNQQQNTESLSDNVTIASSSAHSDEGTGEQPEKMSISRCENAEIVDNFKDDGKSGGNNEKQLHHQLRPRLRNSPNTFRRGLAGVNGSLFKHLQRGRPKYNYDNFAKSKVRKFNIDSFCSLAENRSNANINDDKVYLEEIETATMLDEDEDEDYLFARLVVARLKKFDPKKRREMRSRINQWLDQEEDKIELATIYEKRDIETGQMIDGDDMMQRL